MRAALLTRKELDSMIGRLTGGVGRGTDRQIGIICRNSREWFPVLRCYHHLDLGIAWAFFHPRRYFDGLDSALLLTP